MLLSHPGLESAGLNSWVLAAATIGLETKQKKAFTSLFAEGNTTDTRDSGKPQKMEFERCNSSLKSHLFPAASAAKKFTMIRILQLVTSGEITIFRTMPLSYIYCL